jgi:hypothetical protein
MDEFNDTEIARLLRLKRYEQPPPGYFENFLHEFHRRQRDELLRQPLWRICLERAHNFMLQLDMRSLASYPTAVAAMLVCAAIFSLKVYQQPETARVATQSPLTLSVPVNAQQEWNLASPVRFSGRSRFALFVKAPRLTERPRHATCSIASP